MTICKLVFEMKRDQCLPGSKVRELSSTNDGDVTVATSYYDWYKLCEYWVTSSPSNGHQILKIICIKRAEIFGKMSLTFFSRLATLNVVSLVWFSSLSWIMVLIFHRLAHQTETPLVGVVIYVFYVSYSRSSTGSANTRYAFFELARAHWFDKSNTDAKNGHFKTIS